MIKPNLAPHGAGLGNTCWLNHTPYDPARHGAAAALTAPIAA